jgi:hypothetical protein
MLGVACKVGVWRVHKQTSQGYVAVQLWAGERTARADPVALDVRRTLKHSSSSRKLLDRRTPVWMSAA